MLQALLAGVASIKAQQTRMNVIGNNLAKEFIDLKRMEWVEYSRHVSSWETQRYIEMF